MLKLLMIISMFFSGATLAKDSTLPTLDYVDLNQYVGKWYAITSLPQKFTKSCLYQTAKYKIIDSHSVSVLNTCFKGKKRRGPRRTLRNVKTTIRGTAVVDDQTNADLTVTFRVLFGWIKFSGDYKILALDDDYQYALVGSEDRKSLWILSKTKSLPVNIRTEFTKLASELGFDITKLIESKFY